MKLGNTDRWSELAQRHIDHFQGQLGLDGAAEQLTEAVAGCLSAWRTSSGFGLPDEHREALEAHWRRVPLLCAHLP